MILSIKMWLCKVFFSDVEQSLLNQRNFKWLREWQWIPLLWLLIDELLSGFETGYKLLWERERNQAIQEVRVGEHRENLNLEKLYFLFLFVLFLVNECLLTFARIQNTGFVGNKYLRLIFHLILHFYFCLDVFRDLQFQRQSIYFLNSP